MLAGVSAKACRGIRVGMNFQQASETLKRISLELTHESGKGIHHFLWICDYETAENMAATGVPIDDVPALLRNILSGLETLEVESHKNEN